MDFTRATSTLIGGVTLKDLAKETGTSHGVLRLARLDPSNPGHCNPPAGWQAAALKLARRRSTELSKLIDQLSRDPEASTRPRSKPARAKKAAARRRTAAKSKRGRR